MHIKELKVKDVWILIKDFELHNETLDGTDLMEKN